MSRKKPALAFIALVLALPLMGQDEGCDTSTEEPAKDAREDQPKKAGPDPDGTYDGTCDYLLGDFTEGPGGYKLIAGGTVENTGNIGIVAVVRAEWTMLGSSPITKTRRVRLRPGASREVQMNVPATQSQIDQHQSAQAKCKSDVEIVDTFGRVAD